jgi:Domain of unknown function (DUF4129)
VTILSSALLYLLALNGVVCCVLAWGRPGPASLAGWALALAAAQSVGERLEPWLASIDAMRRERMAVFFGTIQLSALVMALVLAAGDPSPRLLGMISNAFCGYLLLVLLLVRLDPHGRSAVGHSIALLALVALGGGPLAAWAAGSTLALVGLYAALDHHARLLAAHRLDDGPHAARTLAEAALLVLPVAVAVGLAVGIASPEAMMDAPPELGDGRYRETNEGPKRELDTRALRSILVTGILGAVMVYFVGRWLVRSKKRERGSIEVPEPLRGRLERIQPEARQQRADASYPGRRGRIVRAYLGLLRAAERAGFPRRPSETPNEFAGALLEPRAPLEEATVAFVNARYGPYEVGDDEVMRAERGAAAVAAHLARRPPRRRTELVHDAPRPE